MVIDWRLTNDVATPEDWKERFVGRQCDVFLWARPDGTSYLEYPKGGDWYLSQDFPTVGVGYNTLTAITPESLPA